jgi:hypothetical protein
VVKTANWPINNTGTIKQIRSMGRRRRQGNSTPQKKNNLL